MPDFSVVIPTFRRQTQLAEAIESVLAQGEAVEIIVLDDSPEGSARPTAERYADAGVLYVQQQPPSGGKPALVRNSGWRHGSGQFVHFLDDDDRVAAGYYKLALQQFDRYPNVGVVFGQIEPFANVLGTSIQHEVDFFASAARRARRLSRVKSRLALTSSLLFHPTVLVNSACIVRRRCIEPVGEYDATLGLNEDVDFHCRVARRFGYRFLDRVVVHYRINNDSLMHGREDNRKLFDAYDKMYKRYRQEHGISEYFALKMLARTLLRMM